MIRRSRSLSWRSYLCFFDIIDGLYSSSAHPAVIVLQRRNALYAYPYFAGGFKATCECSSKWSSENGQNASTNIPYYLRSYIEGFPCVPRNFRRFILSPGQSLIRIRRSWCRTKNRTVCVPVCRHEESKQPANFHQNGHRKMGKMHLRIFRISFVVI